MNSLPPPPTPAQASAPVRQLLLRLLLAAHVPAVLVVGVFLLIEAQHARHEAVASMGRLAQAVNGDIDERVTSVQAHLLRLSDELTAGPLDLEALRVHARTEQALAQVDAIVLFDQDGRQLLNTLVPAGIPLAATRATVDGAAALRLGRMAVSDVFLAPTARAHMVGIGVPVVAANQIRYGLSAAMQPEQWEHLTQHHHLPKDWTLTIVDRKGVVLGDRSLRERVGTAIAPNLFQRIVGRTEGWIEADTLGGEEGPVAFRHSPLTGWTVLVHAPAAALHASVWRSAVTMLLALLLLLATGFLIALHLSRRVSASIEQLAAGARQLREGAPVRIPPLAFREADEFARAFEEASATLQERSMALRRVTQNFDRMLLSQLETWQAGIGRELHDSVGSALGGVSLMLASARPLVTSSAASGLLDRSQAELRGAAELVRKLSRGVMPVGTDPGALLPALEQLAQDAGTWQEVRCEVFASGSFEEVTPEVGNHVFRIIQEAVGNARRHGGARHIDVRLVQSEGGYEASIVDDGCGADFDAGGHSHAGVGLRSMRARAEAIGGTIRFCSAPGAGCRVHLAWGGDHATTAADACEA